MKRKKNLKMRTRQQAMFEVLRPIDYTDSRRTIVVLGAPRGGTSMLAGVLEKLGIFMGEALGHQKEDRRFRKETPTTTKIQAVAENNAAHMIWGWKLPNTIYYYAELHSRLSNPVFISVYRNPFNVAVSSARRDKRELTPRLFKVPINHYAKMHQLIEQYPDVPWSACSFDSLVTSQNKDYLIDGLLDFLQIDVGKDMREAALGFIDYEKGYRQPTGML